MRPGELWALLGGPRGFHRFDVDGRLLWVDVEDRGRFCRLVDGAAREYAALQLGAVPFHGRDATAPGYASVLWARAETPDQREAVEHFAPVPSLVLAAGARRDVLWALDGPLSRGWVLQANLRLAHRLGTKKAYAGPWFSFTPAGCVSREGRSRPVVVGLVSWTGALYTARDVVGGLEDPPDPRAAWKAQQAA
jgi:hypothetical protein